MKTVIITVLVIIVSGCSLYRSDLVISQQPEHITHERFTGNIVFHDNYNIHFETPKSRLSAGLSHANSWGIIIGTGAGAIPATMKNIYFFPGFAVGYALQYPVTFLIGYTRPEVRMLREYSTEDHLATHRDLVALVNSRISNRDNTPAARTHIVWESGLGNEFPAFPFPFNRLYYYIVYSDAEATGFYSLRSESKYSFRVWMRYFAEIAHLDESDIDVDWFFERTLKPITR